MSAVPPLALPYGYCLNFAFHRRRLRWCYSREAAYTETRYHQVQNRSHQLGLIQDPSSYAFYLLLFCYVGLKVVSTVAAARAIVTEYGDLENQALIPYDRLVTLPHTFAVGSVVSIQRPTGTQTSGLVTLDDGSEVPFAMLVLATGFSWPKVFDWPTTQKGVAEVLREHREKLQAANSAVVAGGGALGLEIAGEINHFYPVRDVHSEVGLRMN